MLVSHPPNCRLLLYLVLRHRALSLASSLLHLACCLLPRVLSLVTEPHGVTMGRGSRFVPHDGLRCRSYVAGSGSVMGYVLRIFMGHDSLWVGGDAL
jgi:hypothetical protein